MPSLPSLRLWLLSTSVLTVIAGFSLLLGINRFLALNQRHVAHKDLVRSLLVDQRTFASNSRFLAPLGVELLLHRFPTYAKDVIQQVFARAQFHGPEEIVPMALAPTGGGINISGESFHHVQGGFSIVRAGPGIVEIGLLVRPGVKGYGTLRSLVARFGHQGHRLHPRSRKQPVDFRLIKLAGLQLKN